MPAYRIADWESRAVDGNYGNCDTYLKIGQWNSVEAFERFLDPKTEPNPEIARSAGNLVTSIHR
jgi:hypothetical protein